MGVRKSMLTHDQWEKIRPLIPLRPPKPKGGRPPADDRACLGGILWILKTGARWRDLPAEYPDPSTCWRRLRDWHEAGVLIDMWRALLSELDAEGILDWDESFVDAIFIPEKKGRGSRKNEEGQGNQCLVVVDGQGLPLGSHTDSASPAEIRLLEKVIADIKAPKKGPGRPKTRPTRVIGDKAYDSDSHRKQLRKRGVNPLSLHRKNHRNVNRQDDRLWDRYRRRYIVERSFARLGTFRRLAVRYENHIGMFVASWSWRL